VTRAQVRVHGEQVSAIGPGLVILVGIGHGDTPEVVEQMAARCVALRIFSDEAGKTNLALADVAGEVLAVSQFTLFADTSRGRRPSFLGAARADLGEELYGRFVSGLESLGVRVARGIFGAEMEVELVNDGPFTLWLDSAGSGPGARG